MKKPSRIRTEVVQLPKLHPELPSLPEAFASTDYDGWPVEVFKRFQLQQYQKTQAERIEVLKQINEIQRQCMTLARNESDWRHFGQEDRIRQKRLDLQELELDQQLEDRRYEREKKLFERANPAKVSEPPKRRDLVEQITAEVEQAILTQTGVKEVFRRARERSPHLTAWLNDWEAKVEWDMRERKWF